MAQNGWLAQAAVERIARIGWFGHLIANTGMHDGNLAFFPGLEPAPVYDMLPMGYAPQRGGEVPPRDYMPPLPLPREASAWREAAHAAVIYWQRCAEDSRISCGIPEDLPGQWCPCRPHPVNDVPDGPSDSYMFFPV